MKIQKVSLLPEQAAWFSRNVLKMLQLLENKAKKTGDKVTERTTYKVLNSLRAKAEEAGKTVEAFGLEEEYEFELFPSKKQKQVVFDLISSVHKTLTEGTIPKYETQNRTEYLEKAKAKAEFLEELRRRFR